MNEIKSNQTKPKPQDKFCHCGGWRAPIGGRLVTLEPIVQLNADAPLPAAR